MKSKSNSKAMSPKASKSKGEIDETLLKTTSQTIEAEEDSEEETAVASSATSGAAASMLAAQSATEVNAGSLKNFRHHPDMENFYRFIYENDLRTEAVQIIDQMMEQKETLSTLRAAKQSPH